MTARIAKGSCGYIDSMKKHTVIKAAVIFAAAASVFVTGYMAFGRKENLLTVVAVLVVLPGARAFVNALMFLRFKSCERRLYDSLEKAGVLDRCFFDGIVTIERGASYYVPCFFATGATLWVLCPASKKGRDELLEHLESMFAANGINGVKVMIFERETDFLRGASRTDTDMKREEAVKSLLAAITL